MRAISVSIWARNSSRILRRSTLPGDDAVEQLLGLGRSQVGGVRRRMAVIGGGGARLWKNARRSRCARR